MFVGFAVGWILTNAELRAVGLPALIALLTSLRALPTRLRTPPTKPESSWRSSIVSMVAVGPSTVGAGVISGTETATGAGAGAARDRGRRLKTARDVNERILG